VKIRVAWVQARPGKDKNSATAALTKEYVQRLARYTSVETHELASESALMRVVEAQGTKPFLVLLDARGKQFSSEELAQFISAHQTRGTQQLLFALGGADGFSEQMRTSAGVVLSLGKMTLPHELARVVLLEQLYRAFTIIKGHPYHTGH
jgi:23S rRNA (pseudouridine1915-N3)-methyltransferase